MKKNITKSRRQFFKTIAAAGITPALYGASPLVGSLMMSRSAEAAGLNGVNKSFIILACGGTIDSYWRPSADLTLKPMSMGYESVKHDMNFMAGMNLHKSGHGVMDQRFRSNWVGDTFDANMGRTLGENSPVPFINLGVNTGTGSTYQGNSRKPATNNAQAAINQLFGSATPAATTSNSTTGPDPRVALVDSHKLAIEVLNRKLDQHERHKLDQHLTSIESFERRYINSSGGGGSCGPAPSIADFGSTFKKDVEIQTAIAVLAMQCGITPSVSLCLGHDDSTYAFRDNGRLMHASHHDLPLNEYLDDINFMSSINANILQQLKDADLLASTVVAQNTDMGDGRGHANTNISGWMAGAGIKKGQVTALSGSVNQFSMYSTIANLTGADTHPEYKALGKSAISEVMS